MKMRRNSPALNKSSLFVLLFCQRVFVFLLHFSLCFCRFTFHFCREVVSIFRSFAPPPSSHFCPHTHKQYSSHTHTRARVHTHTHKQYISQTHTLTHTHIILSLTQVQPHTISEFKNLSANFLKTFFYFSNKNGKNWNLTI